MLVFAGCRDRGPLYFMMPRRLRGAVISLIASLTHRPTWLRSTVACLCRSLKRSRTSVAQRDEHSLILLSFRDETLLPLAGCRHWRAWANYCSLRNPWRSRLAPSRPPTPLLLDRHAAALGFLHGIEHDRRRHVALALGRADDDQLAVAPVHALPYSGSSKSPFNPCLRSHALLASISADEPIICVRILCSAMSAFWSPV